MLFVYVEHVSHQALVAYFLLLYVFQVQIDLLWKWIFIAKKGNVRIRLSFISSFDLSCLTSCIQLVNINVHWVIL